MQLFGDNGYSSRPTFLVGDFYVDLLKYQQHNLPIGDFDNMIMSHYFLLLILHPIRITTSTAILTGNNIIYTKSSQHMIDLTIVVMDISDRLSAITSLTIVQPRANTSSEEE